MISAKHKTQLRDILESFNRWRFMVFVTGFLTALLDGLSLWMIVPFLRKALSENSPAGDGRTNFLTRLDNTTLFSLLLLFFGGKIVLTFVYNKQMTQIQWGRMEYWARSIMDNYLHSNYLEFTSKDHGKLLNDLSQETQVAAQCLRDIMLFFSQGAFVFVLLTIILVNSWAIAVGLLLMAGVTVVVNMKLKRGPKGSIGKIRISMRQKIETVASENIAAFRQIKIFNMEQQRIDQLSKPVHELAELMIRYLNSKRIIIALPQIMMSVLLLGAFVYIRYANGPAIVSLIPQAAFLLLVVQRLFPALSQLIACYTSIKTSLPSLRAVQRLSRPSPAREPVDVGLPVERIANGIEFRNVTYGYPGKPPLFENLSITIQAHHTTALIGPSGSGKSTLADLLVGLLHTTAGEVLVDGRDLRSLGKASLRRRIGYVSQDTALFNTTIRQNLLVGKPGASDEELWEACRGAHAAGFIERMPQGLETPVGERGVRLSGGERQRLAIARALLRDPDLFIFDEATSALDLETEVVIQQTLASLRGHKTVLLITHRLQLAELADQLYLVNQGKVSALESVRALPAALAQALQASAEPVGQV
jgi:ABC-type multidrug transport system fused ATPase/permease subunit